jgi:hypothetical protein
MTKKNESQAAPRRQLLSMYQEGPKNGQTAPFPEEPNRQRKGEGRHRYLRNVGSSDKGENPEAISVPSNAATHGPTA